MEHFSKVITSRFEVSDDLIAAVILNWDQNLRNLCVLYLVTAAICSNNRQNNKLSGYELNFIGS